MGGNQKISLAEEVKSAPKEYVLSINLRINGLSFLLRDKNGRQLQLEHFEWSSKTDWSGSLNKLRELVENSELSKKDFHQTSIYLQAPHSFILPDKAAGDKLEKIYHTYLGLEQHQVFSQELFPKAYLVYGLPNEVYQLIINEFPKASWKHCSAAFIARSMDKVENGQVLFVNHHSGYIEVVSIKNKKLEAHNYFPYGNTDEYLFNLISFARQTGMNIEKLHIHLKGQIIENSKLHQSVLKYFPNVLFEAVIRADMGAVNQEFIEAVNYENR